MPAPTLNPPNLFLVVASRIFVAALLAFSFLTAYTVITGASRDTELAPAFVATEITSLLKNASFERGTIQLPAVKTLEHYAQRHSKYAFRIFSLDGRLLVSRNETHFEQFQKRPLVNSATRTVWATTQSQRPLWMAGGEARIVDGRRIQVEVATLGDPAWRRRNAFFQSIMSDRLLGQLIAVLLTSALAVFLVSEILKQPRSRKDGEIGVATKSAASGTSALLEELSETVHDTRSSLALILLQLDKLPKEATHEIEKDVATIAESIDKISALAKKVSDETN